MKGSPEEDPVGITLLVVDRVEPNRLVLATWLAEAGYVVEEAANGADALARAGAGSLDLVLCNVDLPDMSGLEVCRRLKTLPSSAALPVVHLSATFVEPAHRTAGLRSGADGYLVQPVTKDELLANVEAVLRYSRARKRAERLAVRLERLNVASLEMSRATSFLALLGACAEQSAVVLAERAVVVATGDGQAVVARAGPSGLVGIERLETVPPVLDPSGFPLADEPFTVPALHRSEPYAGLDLGRTYRVVAVHARQSGARAIVAAELVEGAPGEELGETDLVLRQVARALGVALSNLHALRVERAMALQLQHSLLPTSLPALEGLEVAVRYVASAENAEVGGDFFEVLALPSGRVGIAIGDVQGHSLDAAAVMAGLRHGLRAYALEGHSPAAVLERLNALLVRAHPGLIATACYGELERSSRRLVVANAGHVPPLVAGSSGTRYLPTHGVLLGIEGPAPTEVEVVLEEGATLVWVTDGLVERRSEPLQTGLDRLAATVRRSSASADREGLEELCDRLLDLVGPWAADDVALVACRLVAGPPG